MDKEKLNIALVGPGGIAERVARGIRLSKNASLYSVCSRDKERAEEFKSLYGAQKACSLEEVFEDEKVDLIYLCVPTTVHYDVALACLEHGKNVMCEKPITVSLEKLRELFFAARENGCFLMEAQKAAFTPLTVKLLSLLEEGAIGMLRAIKAEYSFRLADDASPWLFDSESGGVAGDLGSYPVCFANRMAASPIGEASTVASPMGSGECDRFMASVVRYQNGVVANLVSSWYYSLNSGPGDAYLGGDKGYIYVPAFWKSNKAYLVRDGEETLISVDCESEFSPEIDHAAWCISHGLKQSPVMSEEASADIQRIFEQVKRNCARL